ncbi:hypothetical protein JVX98_13245 [Ensifer sp. PDNC004]|uniref:hypothetical protein n=1 Tax=Ensifer sp. PDNC004 TaxID=2811423 RepID=UPI001966348E|nr:hypothetical protein [Ensifer sp. PDNC004]QRY69180.1 hypothetical protein JVX98_13245 [Ensifer sp. PDNC004]
MTDATTNSPFVGESDSARPALTFDDAANLDFAEPGEANEEEETEGQSTDATGEATEDEGQETGENADQGDEPNDAENGEEANETQDTVITLKGGEQVPLEELKLGYMRDRDYRHKTQDLGNKSRNLDAMTTRVTNTVNNIAEFLIQQLPPEPTRALAMQNPAEYTRQKAVYDDSLDLVNRLIDMGGEPKKVGEELKAGATEEALAEESAKLAEAFPEAMKTEEGHKKFFDDAFATARQLGFADDEMKGITDHRIFKLAHYARIGLAAEQAKGKALTKVNNAPPAPVKAKPNGPVNPQAKSSREAMSRLSKTGSIRDAMSVDFD